MAVGDVVGHDMTAAAVMGQVRSATRAVLTTASGPADLVNRLQRMWGVLALDRMATAVHVWLDPRSGALRIATAGHQPPLLVVDGEASPLPVPPSPMLGIPGEAAREWTGMMPRGATLLLFTDGLVERRGRSTALGLADVRAALSGIADSSPVAVCDAMMGVVDTTGPSDDVALLAVRCRPSAASGGGPRGA